MLLIVIIVAVIALLLQVKPMSCPFCGETPSKCRCEDKELI
jgi:hypothetical protein